MRTKKQIPVIDIFAGPGGLSEGFSANGFDIRLSIEKDASAHQTLELRAFFRQFDAENRPDEYYRHLSGELTREQLFSAYPQEAETAQREAWHAELGANNALKVHSRIRDAISKEEPWVLIGGPPCQAYSLAGRSRNKGKHGYKFEDDPRATLYRQYLRIIADFWPSVFVMENVKGLLSSKFDGEHVFKKICDDLQDPNRAFGNARQKHTYTLHSLVDSKGLFANEPRDFLVESEKFGIPQSRHRIFVIGIRDDIKNKEIKKLTEVRPQRTVFDAIDDLPKLRSGLSGKSDNTDSWRQILIEFCDSNSIASALPTVREFLTNLKSRQAEMRALDRGGEHIRKVAGIRFEHKWFLDEQFRGISNHATRGHIPGDLQRYLFSAVWAMHHHRSPTLRDFPAGLLPNHKNAQDKEIPFADRFRVQVSDQPSTTVTSHISKDGHYYIHYDPLQCRSLTVREAARLQTFPDNYFFCGNRTQQYTQVGNAVPPLLAREIAAKIREVLE